MASDCAADCTWAEALPVSDAPRCTSAMLVPTCEVPSAARCTLREISCVAEPCCSTEVVIAAAISEILPIVEYFFTLFVEGF